MTINPALQQIHHTGLFYIILAENNDLLCSKTNVLNASATGDRRLLALCTRYQCLSIGNKSTSRGEFFPSSQTDWCL